MLRARMMFILRWLLVFESLRTVSEFTLFLALCILCQTLHYLDDVSNPQGIGGMSLTL